MRYFFNLLHARGAILDEKGVEVDDSSQIRSEAIRAIEELRRTDPSIAEDWKDWRLEVTDEAGTIILSVHLDQWYQ